MARTTTGTPFADLLRDLRRQAGLTQEELAERAGLTAHAVSALERGVRTRPHPHTVRSLSAALAADAPTRAALVAAVPRHRRSEPAATAAPPLTGAVLSVPDTPLLGRDRDVEAVVRLLLDEGRRLVTLTGTGGVGKTRLAAAVAEQVGGAFPDGTVGVALAAVTDPGEVLPTVARAVGVTLRGDALRDLGAALEGRRCLLVLDNLEHLLDAAPHVAALVSACPSSAVLVTSRAPLRVRGETEHSVEPLPLPDADDARSVEASPAGALLLERARVLAPGFGTAPQEAATVAALCRRLAGIPLALELVAARARVLDAAAMLARLDACAASPAARDLPPRQQTMRATLDWSCSLLGEPERRLLRLLSVFVGGFDLPAAEEVAGGDVLAALHVLVEHHLVVVRAGGRYDLLEPVADHARSLLGEQEAPAARRAHARHYLRLAERAHDGYGRDDQLDWLARAEQDEDNLLLMVERSLADGDTTTAARGCWELQRFWWFRQRTAKGLQLSEQVAAAGPSLPPADLAVASLAAGCMALALDDVGRARRHWETAYALADHVEDVDVRAHAGAGLGLTALVDGDLALADERLVAAHERASRSTRGCCLWLASMCLIWRGTVLTAAGRPAAAQASVAEGLASARRRGDRLAVSMALYNLAHQASAADERDVARRHLVEGVRLAHQTGDLTNLAHVVQSLVVLEVAAGHLRAAAVLHGAAEALLETAGTTGGTYRLLDREVLAGACRRARELLGEEAYDDAVDSGRRLAPDEVLDHVLHTSAPRLQAVAPSSVTA